MWLLTSSLPVVLEWTARTLLCRILAQFAFSLSQDWELPLKRDLSRPLKEGISDMLIKHHLFSWDIWQRGERGGGLCPAAASVFFVEGCHHFLWKIGNEDKSWNSKTVWGKFRGERKKSRKSDVKVAGFFWLGKLVFSIFRSDYFA